MNGHGADKGTSSATNEEDNSTVDTMSITEADAMDMFDNSNRSCDENVGEDLVWYFSYGSNMNAEIFEKKRKIKCRDHKVCKVPGYVLTYARGLLPYEEPAYCTCVKRTILPCGDNRPDIHGVAFLITRQQYDHMLLTEGGWGYQEYRDHPFWTIGHYGEEEIECIEIQPEGCCNNDREGNSRDESSPSPIQQTSFKALTLVGLFGIRQSYDGNASKRYHDLVNIGAESSGLPMSYREYLKDRHPAFEPKHCWRSKLAKYLYFAIAFPGIFIEIGSLQLCIRWNERKMEERKSQQQQVESSRRRQPFEDVVRPPWILMKLCFFYRTFILESLATTLLFDWCKLPDGFRNPCSSEATTSAKKVR